MAVDIRHAGAADREALAELFHDMDRHYWNDEAPSTDEWLRFLDSVVLPASKSCEIVMAEENGRPLGVATFAIVYPGAHLTGQVFLKEIYIRSEARSRGVGRRIMAYIADQALQRGCPRVDWVAEDARAMAFYDGLGARTLDKRVYYRLDGDALSALAGETDGQ
jgi:GNAT superfamily N-acetyltransferase